MTAQRKTADALRQGLGDAREVLQHIQECAWSSYARTTETAKEPLPGLQQPAGIILGSGTNWAPENTGTVRSPIELAIFGDFVLSLPQLTLGLLCFAEHTVYLTLRLRMASTRFEGR